MTISKNGTMIDMVGETVYVYESEIFESQEDAVASYHNKKPEAVTETEYAEAVSWIDEQEIQ